MTRHGLKYLTGSLDKHYVSRIEITTFVTRIEPRQHLYMTSNEASDAILIKSVLSGKTDDFRFLMERYQQQIFSYLYRYLYQNRDAAEDVTQGVFLKVFQNLSTIDLDRPVKPWIYRIAHNEASNYLRTISRKRESYLEDDQWNKFSGESENESMEEEERDNLIQSAVEKLKPKYREVIVLHYFEDKSYEEIAQIIGASTNTVGTLLRRGRQKLETTLKNAGLMVSAVFNYLISSFLAQRNN